MDSLDELREKVQAEYTTRTIPRKGKILVKSLGKEVWYKGTIILPDPDGTKGMQHKPVYEGIVLEVYQPFMHQVRCNVNNEWDDIMIEPLVKVGDHILFPHFEGFAHQRYAAQDIRFIDETSILAVLEYKRKPGTERPMTTSGFSREKG